MAKKKQSLTLRAPPPILYNGHKEDREITNSVCDRDLCCEIDNSALATARFPFCFVVFYNCNEPGREGGLVPTKTDDVYLPSFLTKHKHSPLTYNGLFNTVIIIVHQITPQSIQLQFNDSSRV